MAPGYVIAAFLEVSGLIGLPLAAFLLRAERQAKADDLRSFLRCGRTATAVPVPAAPGRRIAPAPRVVDVPPARIQGSVMPGRDSMARAALRRALARDGRGPAADLAGPVSAG